VRLVLVVESGGDVMKTWGSVSGRHCLLFLVAVAATACDSGTLQPDLILLARLADGVSPAESLAIGNQLAAQTTAAATSSTDQTCTLAWSAPGTIADCRAPLPTVVPTVPWLQHSGEARDPGEIEYRDPIHIVFADSVYGITLSSTGALKCTGTYGRLVAFRNGVQVAEADNALIDPTDCGADDVTYGVRGNLPPAIQIDSLVIEGVNPWTFPVFGECCGRALLKYTIQFSVVCENTVQAIINEYVTFQVNLEPTCADFDSAGGSLHFQWPELNDDWSDGNPHEPWGMIRQGLLDGLEATRTYYNRGGIRLSSGYRCPHGNDAVGGVANSYHMHGRAADMFSADYPWTEQEFNRLRRAAGRADPAPIELLRWDTYTDHHLHAAW
jgi:hypothetical protein